LKDEADNRILECAVAGNADFIVSGDRHLLSLKEFRDIPIVRAAEFLSRLEDGA
jgi:predicted nucleic acid-binding protein